MVAKSPISETTGVGKMSPQAAVGYRNWPDEDGRQTKHRRKPYRESKAKTLRTHRIGK